MIKDLRTINKTGPIENLADFPANLNESPSAPPEWQRELAQAIRDPAELLQRLNLTDHFPAPWKPEASDFPLLVPESFLKRMEPGNPRDPLLLQVLPDRSELASGNGFTKDAVGDVDALQGPGLLRKYTGRALLITLGQCAVHCRYCFRRHFPYAEQPRSREEWRKTLELLADQPDVDEIILSGGDPLVLNDRRLGQMVEDLAAVPGLRRIRVHTRLPIVIPSRVTEDLLAIFRETGLQPLFVVHANHPAEISGECPRALQQLVRSGIPTLNQAVLLRGVNDTTEIQAELCRRLINLGVIPYYLHQLDRVQGASHFETELPLGPRIVAELKTLLPGYAVPRFVREIPGQPSKTEILDDSAE